MTRCIRTTKAHRASAVHPDDLATLDAYTETMRRRGFAAGTIDKRRRSVELIAAECRLAELTPELFEAFLDARQLSHRSRYCWLSHVSVFYQWAVLHEIYSRNPIAKLQRPKLRRLLPNPTREAEVEVAIAKAPTATMRAWIVLAAFAGLRCCEIATLRGEDIDRDARKFRVVGKGDKERVIPMHARVLDVLADAPRVGYVFRDAALDEPYRPATVSRLGGTYLESLGLRNDNMHQLRHRFGTALLEVGADITTVADLMGHENLNTTRGYALVTNKRMRNAVDLLT